MEYKHLELIQALMSIKSASNYNIGRSTVSIKRNHEDAAGAMANIKMSCDRGVYMVACAYCIECGRSYSAVRELLRSSIANRLAADGREDDGRACKMAGIVMAQVFHGALSTTEQCGRMMGMSKQSYSERWKRYVDVASRILTSMLSVADAAAEDYFRR